MGRRKKKSGGEGRREEEWEESRGHNDRERAEEKKWIAATWLIWFCPSGDESNLSKGGKATNLWVGEDRFV